MVETVTITKIITPTDKKYRGGYAFSEQNKNDLKWDAFSELAKVMYGYFENGWHTFNITSDVIRDDGVFWEIACRLEIKKEDE